MFYWLSSQQQLDWKLQKLSLRVFAITGRDFEKLHAYQFLVTRWLQKNTHPLSLRVFLTIHWKDMQASPLHRHQGKDTTLQVARTTLIPAPQTMGTLEWEKKQKRSFVSSLSVFWKAQTTIEHMNGNMILDNRTND